MSLNVSPFCLAVIGTKRQTYEEQVHEIEHASLSSFVLSTSGGMGASTTVTYKYLAFLLSLK